MVAYCCELACWSFVEEGSQLCKVCGKGQAAPAAAAPVAAAPAAVAPAAKKAESKKESKKDAKKGAEKGGDKAKAAAAIAARAANPKPVVVKKEEKKVDPAAEAAKAELKLIAACKKEGGKKGQDIAGMSSFGVAFFCVTILDCDGRMDMLQHTMDGMNAEVDPEGEDRKGGAGDLGKILFTASDKELSIYCHCPKEVVERATCKEFMEGVLKVTGCTILHEDENFIKAHLTANPDAGIYALKLRDEGINAAFTFLRSRQLVIEDDSDDEDYQADSGINLNAGPGNDY